MHIIECYVVVSPNEVDEASRSPPDGHKHGDQLQQTDGPGRLQNIEILQGSGLWVFITEIWSKNVRDHACKVSLHGRFAQVAIRLEYLKYFRETVEPQDAEAAESYPHPAQHQRYEGRGDGEEINHGVKLGMSDMVCLHTSMTVCTMCGPVCTVSYLTDAWNMNTSLSFAAMNRIKK